MRDPGLEGVISPAPKGCRRNAVVFSPVYVQTDRRLPPLRSPVWNVRWAPEETVGNATWTWYGGADGTLSMNGGSQWDDLQRELEGGVVRRSSQLIAAGVCPAVIADALRHGRIAKAAPGAYYLPQPDVLGWEMAVAAACSRMPRAVACLLTAAQLHELVPARAAEAPLWFGLSPSDHAGKAGGVPYRILRWSWRGAGEVGV